MLIGAKSSRNRCLIFIFYTKIYYVIKTWNKLIFLHIIKSNILFYKCPKYEIISLTFGPSKIVWKYL
jgi:hypothetical protein